MKSWSVIIVLWGVLWLSNMALPAWHEATFKSGDQPRRRLDVLLDVLGESRTLLARYLWFTAENYHEILEMQGVAPFQEKDLLPLYRMVTYLDPRIEEAFDISSYDMLHGYGDNEKALDIVNEGLEYTPKSYKLNFRKAFTLHHLKLYAQAIPPAERALLSYHEDVDELNACRILYVCYDEQKRYEDALRILNLWLSLRSDDIRAQTERVKILQKLGRSQSTLAIEVKGLRKTYRTATGGVHEALRGVDLQVESNELFGFVGVNGAGKSTLIKSLVGLLRPGGGEASIFGRPAGTVEARAQLGYLPEISNYHEFLTALELLGVHAALAGVPKKERNDRCQEVLRLVGLGDRQKTRIAEFSKGMKQRFGIAQAIVAKPPLLILDELTSGLDPIAQRELKEIMVSLRATGTTVFFSSHHMSEVEAVCDRVAILHRGRVRAQGRLTDLLSDAASVQVRAILAEEARQVVAAEFTELKMEPLENLEVALTLPRSQVNRLLDLVRQHQGEVTFLSPSRLPLEEFYFKVVQEANREDGVAA